MTTDRNLCLIGLTGLFIPFIGPFLAGATLGFCYLAVDGENMKEELQDTESRLQNVEMELYELNKDHSDIKNIHYATHDKLSTDHNTQEMNQPTHATEEVL